MCLCPIQDKFFCKVQQILLNKQEDFCGNKMVLVRTMREFNRNVRAGFFGCGRNLSLTGRRKTVEEQVWCDFLSFRFSVKTNSRGWRQMSRFSCPNFWLTSSPASGTETCTGRLRSSRHWKPSKSNRNEIFFLCFNIHFWSECCQIQAEGFQLACLWLFICVLYLI